jgi:(E)-4-hydroxy-3-methylbut-2-enyl-diphosphate synthase
MTNTFTSDIRGSVAQSIRIIQAGADYVRLTVPSLQDVEAVSAIRQKLLEAGYVNPLIADVHFNADVALRVAEKVDKVRINPGNFTDRGKFLALVELCRLRGIALRIGVNHGSLSERIMKTYGDTPEGMAESAMEFLRICQERGFNQAVVSMKASNVRIMVYATRLVARKMAEEDMHFPIHLGVTEAGEGEDGRIKSAVGIGTLLADGLGDTIRVSLTEEPEAEIPVARRLVEYLEVVSKHTPLPEILTWPADPCSFRLRQTRVSGNIGGNNPPIVIGSDALDPRIILVEASLQDISANFIRERLQHPDTVLIYNLSNANIQGELRWLHHILNTCHSDVPVVFRLHLAEKDPADFLVKSSASLGGAFIDGFGNGIWLTNAYPLPSEMIRSTAFGILQACRARMTRTEYIACPSCGRTHFNLIDTLTRIKSATSHLKGLKIGVMGCIVNGPGEMADADYGYVGAGKGKITLYKAREVVKRGIPEENAVEELISLIKENGDWKEP